MIKALQLLTPLVLLTLWSCQHSPSSFQCLSPNGQVSVRVFEQNTRIGYQVSFNEEVMIDSSFVAFEFRDAPPIGQDLIVTNRVESSHAERWEMPWGEKQWVDNNYQELILELQEMTEPKRIMHIVFKVYDDGVGFRYEFPEQPDWQEAIITDELTEFQLTGDHTAWWIPGDWDIYEHLYRTTPVSGINALQYRDHPNLAASYIPENAVNTPVTMKTASGKYLSFHEADLTNYAGMTLKIDTSSLKMTSELVGAKEGHKVKAKLPFVTPWRTIQFGERAADLIGSDLIVNLNEPVDSTLDISWFKPMKYVGIWWEMHLDESTWQYEGGRHGATTEHAKELIDFAADNNIGGLLVEGWNIGWERWIGFPDREGVFDFVTPYPDYDLEEVVAYGRGKGVALIMHHETSAAPRTYDQQLDTAYQLMQSLGIHTVKTGYVGPIIPDGERHHGQWMVNHYQKVLEKGLEYQVAINAHEPIKATGKRRTYPNAISREGLRGQEFNAWAVELGNPPDHLTIVPFTRMLAGPIDFTPGIFNIKMTPYRTEDESHVNTTLAHQLALFVVIYSPVQMAADLIESYQGQPAFQFVRDVAVDWSESRALDGDIGAYVVIARKERVGDRWFIGGVTDEIARNYTLDFGFLPRGEDFEAIRYIDGVDAHWDANPTAISIDTVTVSAQTRMPIQMAPGGGFAISVIPK